LAENWRAVGNVATWSLGAALGYAKVIKPLSELIQKHRLLNKAKQSEIYIEENLARIRALNERKATYLAEGLTGEDSGFSQWVDEQVKYHQDLADKHTKIASEARKSATALKGFGGALKSIGSFIKANWVGMLITAVTALVSWLISARQETNRLNKELAKIGTEGALQGDQSVRNFEYLAKVIRESADGSEKHTKALAEMKRSYGDLLPTQDKEIQALIQEKSNYDALIESIRKKINLQMHEQKLNAIASEYGGRISKQENKLQKSLSEIGLSPTEIGRIFESVRQSVQDGATLGIEDFARILSDNTTLAFERVGKSSVISAGLFKGIDVRDFEKYIETLGEYNNQIELVGGSLDHLDDKGKKLSDTFNTWQKELSAITEGKNLKGEGIRVFDDENIAQTPKLTSALEKVAEKYKKLKEEKKQVDKALLSEGAKADKQTYSQLEQRLGKINEGMSGLYDFLKKYGGLDLIKDGDKGGELARLQKELQLHEKIYAKYKEYRKYMSAEEAKAKVEDYFGDTIDALKFKPSFDKSGYQNVLEQYKKVANTLLAKAKDETEKGAIKKFLLDIGFKIDDKDWEETKDDMEKNLKKLSDDLSRTKTAKEFFDRMLGLTGDKQLSASLTLSVYGEGQEDLGQKLASQTIEQLETAFEGVDISSAIDKTTSKVDYAKLVPFIDQLPEKLQQNARALVDAGMKANDDWLTDLQKTYQKAFTFEERRTQVMQQEAEKRKEIEESTLLDDLAKRRYTEASKKREAERISAINLEEFKASDDYLKIFEDIEHLSIPIIDRLIGKIRDFIATNKELSATDLKNLTEQIQKLEEGKISKSALFAGFGAGVKEWFKATNAMAKATKGTKEYEDAVIAANKAHKKVVDSLGVLQGEFSQAQQFVDSFAGSLGIAEDDEFKVFLDDMSNALGGVAQALAFAQLAVQLFDGTIKSFLASNPIGWILLVVSAVIGAFQAIANAKVRNIEKEIERIQSSIENLEYAYEKLQKAQEKAFGSDYISNYRQQLANLEATQDAYLKQAELERSKGKKADVDKIGEYEEAARNTADSIADMYGQLSEHFLGADLASAARDFAVAWIDAYKEFANTTDAMKAKFQDMIQNMIVESLLAKVMEKALEPVFTMIDNMGKGDFYNPSFWQNVMSTMQTATENGVVGAENVMSMLEQMGINLRGLGGDLTGISRDIATASEESILGLAAGINTQNFYISQVPPKLDIIISLLRGEGAMPQGSTITLQDLVTLQNQHLSYLPNIAQNTADTVARCERAAVACENMAEQLGRVIKPNGTPSNYKLHTTINS
jgi:hypothetical protein